MGTSTGKTVVVELFAPVDESRCRVIEYLRTENSFAKVQIWLAGWYQQVQLLLLFLDRRV